MIIKTYDRKSWINFKIKNETNIWIENTFLIILLKTTNIIAFLHKYILIYSNIIYFKVGLVLFNNLTLVCVSITNIWLNLFTFFISIETR